MLSDTPPASIQVPVLLSEFLSTTVMDCMSLQDLQLLQWVTKMLQVLKYQENESGHVLHEDVVRDSPFLKFSKALLAIAVREHKVLAAAPSHAYCSDSINNSDCREPDVSYHILEAHQEDSIKKHQGSIIVCHNQ